MDGKRLKSFVETIWDESVLPSLTDYIRIPNKSPSFDPDWQAHGYMDAAVALMETWARAHLAALKGATLEIVRLPGRTPVLFIDVPGSGTDTVLLYGHLDKQPEMTGWSDGLDPWTPVRRGDRLYGRGGADDGYAMYGALSALLALNDQGIAHSRCVILIEACEESGSYDLPFYVDHLAPRLGTPSLVVCLDSGCGDYERLWLTTSLRGTSIGTLTVKVLTEGVHSGDASGVAPSSFRILRSLLSRVEDEKTGRVLPADFHTAIPAERVAQARHAATVLGKEGFARFPWAGGTKPMDGDIAELILNRTWRPQLSVTGIEGLPAPQAAGAVLLPHTTAKLSLRLPPGLDGEKARVALKTLLERDPPYEADVHFNSEHGVTGWHAPPLAPWLVESITRAGTEAFGHAPVLMGEGGTIPFMAMLGEKFPATQFVITGVLGPGSNAHGPNEFLHIPTGKRVTETVARVLSDEYTRTKK